jgi:hypothetical protein
MHNAFVASLTCTALYQATSEKAKVKSEDLEMFDFSPFTSHLIIKAPNVQVSDTTKA